MSAKSTRRVCDRPQCVDKLSSSRVNASDLKRRDAASGSCVRVREGERLVKDHHLATKARAEQNLLWRCRYWGTGIKSNWSIQAIHCCECEGCGDRIGCGGVRHGRKPNVQRHDDRAIRVAVHVSEGELLGGVIVSDFGTNSDDVSGDFILESAACGVGD